MNMYKPHDPVAEYMDTFSRCRGGGSTLPAEFTTACASTEQAESGRYKMTEQQIQEQIDAINGFLDGAEHRDSQFFSSKAYEALTEYLHSLCQKLAEVKGFRDPAEQFVSWMRILSDQDRRDVLAEINAGFRDELDALNGD